MCQKQPSQPPDESRRPAPPPVPPKSAVIGQTGFYQPTDYGALRCPFCGYVQPGRGYAWVQILGEDSRYRVKCKQCETYGPPSDTKIGCLSTWNTRVSTL